MIHQGDLTIRGICMPELAATRRRRVTTPVRKLSLLAGAACCFLVGVTAAFPQPGPSSQAAPPTQAAPSPPAPPTPVPFDDALLRAANDLFSKAAVPPGDGKIELVIDPLIDGISGAQSTATRLMQERIVALVRKSYPPDCNRPGCRMSRSRHPCDSVSSWRDRYRSGRAADLRPSS